MDGVVLSKRATVDCSEQAGTQCASTQGRRTVVVLCGLSLGHAAVFYTI